MESSAAARVGFGRAFHSLALVLLDFQERTTNIYFCQVHRKDLGPSIVNSLLRTPTLVGTGRMLAALRTELENINEAIRVIERLAGSAGPKPWSAAREQEQTEASEDD